MIAFPLILRDDLHVWPPWVRTGGSDCIMYVYVSASGDGAAVRDRIKRKKNSIVSGVQNKQDTVDAGLFQAEGRTAGGRLQTLEVH